MPLKIEEAVLLSMQITALYVLFMQGNLLGWFRIWIANELDKGFGLKASRYIQKPLWDCLFCMASVWTMILTQSINIGLILTVCGINFLIDKIVSHEADPVE